MRKILILLLLIILPCMGFAAHPNKKMKRILLVVAMDKEAEPIIKKLKLKPMHLVDFYPLPMKAFTGIFANKQIFLIENGRDPVYKVSNIGTEAATLTTYIGIEKFHPDLVISIGTAGGVLPRQVKPGDIYLSKKIYFYNRRIVGKGYHYGIGDYLSYTPKNATLKRGIICTGDDFDQSASDYAMFLKLHCDVIEMEAASVAWVSQLNHIPMIAMKGVTNDVEIKNANAIFHKNFDWVMNKVTTELQLFLRNNP